MAQRVIHPYVAGLMERDAREPSRKRHATFSFRGTRMTVRRVPSGDLADGSYRAFDDRVYAIREGRRLLDMPSVELQRAADVALRRGRR